MFPRVVALTSDNSGCTFYRIWMPFVALRKRGWDARWVHPTRCSSQLLEQTDILVLPRIGIEPVELDRLLHDCYHYGVTLVYETDDDLWRVPEESPAARAILPLRAAMREVLQESDLATVTTLPLRQRVLEERKSPLPVHVLPNMIDRTFWDTSYAQRAARRDDRVFVGVHGSYTHVSDWDILVEVWPRVARQCPQAVFLTIGYCPPQLAEAMSPYHDRFQPIPYLSLRDYPAAVAQLDVACCPLPATTFNASKSDLKFLENSVGGAASVVSPLVYGGTVVEGETGFIRDGAAGWEEAITRLVVDQPLRKAMAKRARGYVLSQREITKQASRWARVYEGARK